jgi:hypothetical protein
MKTHSSILLPRLRQTEDLNFVYAFDINAPLHETKGRVALLVQALHYKPEVRGFDSR